MALTSTTRASGARTRVALVTGSSRGIGRAVAITLASAGYEVILHGSSAGSTDEVAETLRQRYGGDPLALVADVSKPYEVGDMFRSVFDRHRRLDALVINAGIHHAGLLGMTDN